MPFTADIRHDAAARVWYVHASDLPGLHAEAATLDALVAVIQDVAPDLAAGLLPQGGVAAEALAEVAVRIQHVIVAGPAHAA